MRCARNREYNWARLTAAPARSEFALASRESFDDRVASFHVDQVWESPSGEVYRVEEVAENGVAVLRRGAAGEGYRVGRPHDAVFGWYLQQDGRRPRASKRRRAPARRRRRR